MPEEAGVEASVPTQRSPSGQAPRLPAPDVHTRRSRRLAGSSPQGSRPIVGLTRTIGARAAFRELHRSSDRARHGPLSAVRVAAPGEMRPGVAYSIPRQVGTAVTRNRVRRRMRAVARELAGGTDPLLGAGDHLFVVRADITELTFDSLRDCMAGALRNLDRLPLSFPPSGLR